VKIITIGVKPVDAGAIIKAAEEIKKSSRLKKII